MTVYAAFALRYCREIEADGLRGLRHCREIGEDGRPAERSGLLNSIHITSISSRVPCLVPKASLRLHLLPGAGVAVARTCACNSTLAVGL